jgi:hypothetical protein
MSAAARCEKSFQRGLPKPLASPQRKSHSLAAKGDTEILMIRTLLVSHRIPERRDCGETVPLQRNVEARTKFAKRSKSHDAFGLSDAAGSRHLGYVILQTTVSIFENFAFFSVFL